jgi:hypothetical protein
MTLIRFVPIVCIVVSATSARAQRLDLDNPVNFGRQWRSWSDPTRSIYLNGFVDGGSETFQVAFFSPDMTAAGKEQLRGRPQRFMTRI